MESFNLNTVDQAFLQYVGRLRHLETAAANFETLSHQSGKRTKANARAIWEVKRALDLQTEFMNQEKENSKERFEKLENQLFAQTSKSNYLSDQVLQSEKKLDVLRLQKDGQCKEIRGLEEAVELQAKFSMGLQQCIHKLVENQESFQKRLGELHTRCDLIEKDYYEQCANLGKGLSRLNYKMASMEDFGARLKRLENPPYMESPLKSLSTPSSPWDLPRNLIIE